jgi:Uncharacterized anaerobic dehydrogenase
VTIIVNRNKCGYCGACVAVCPTMALELKEVWIDSAKQRDKS